ncbi:alpha-ketoglutarate-dependent dioxygenase AlkB, partial [Streptomyces sp. adm13(2018)]
MNAARPALPGLQGSLFDQGDEIRFGPLDGLRRTPLDAGAWVDHLPGWLHGADVLFEELADHVPWRAEERPMYDTVVAVPRLLAHYGEGAPLPHPALAVVGQEPGYGDDGVVH